MAVALQLLSSGLEYPFFVVPSHVEELLVR